MDAVKVKKLEEQVANLKKDTYELATLETRVGRLQAEKDELETKLREEMSKRQHSSRRPTPARSEGRLMHGFGPG